MSKTTKELVDSKELSESSITVVLHAYGKKPIPFFPISSLKQQNFAEFSHVAFTAPNSDASTNPSHNNLNQKYLEMQRYTYKQRIASKNRNVAAARQARLAARELAQAAGERFLNLFAQVNEAPHEVNKTTKLLSY